MSDPSTSVPPEQLLAQSADSVPQPPLQPPNNIFRGPNGIRAGWRVLIYLVLAAAVAALLIVIVGAIARGRAQTGVSQITPLGTGLSELGIFLVAAIPALIMARIEGRTWGDYGLPLHSAFRSNFWIGGLVGFLAISFCLLGIFAFHGFHLTGLAIHGETILVATLGWSAAFVVVGLAEEFAFRGYLQYTLTTGMGFWPSAILLSVLFAAAHGRNPGETAAGLVSVVVFALLFCLFLRRTGDLWLAVGFHAGWDWGQTFFYGVPDSGLAAYHNLLNSSFSGKAWLTGGTVGPEASVFTPIVLLIVGIAFAALYGENRYPVRDSVARP